MFVIDFCLWSRRSLKAFLFFHRDGEMSERSTKPDSFISQQEWYGKVNGSYDDSGKPNMLWYQQKDTAMALIVLSLGATVDPSYEDGFDDRFKLERKDTLNGVLKISDLSQSDSAVYYCAVSMHSAVVLITCLTKNQTTRHTGNTHRNHSNISKILLY